MTFLQKHPRIAGLVALVYPVTKRKLHRLLHIGGSLLTVVVGLAMWATENSIKVKLGVDLALVIAWGTRGRALLGQLDAAVEASSLPDSGEVIDAKNVLPFNPPDPAAPNAPASEAPTKVEKGNPEKSK